MGWAGQGVSLGHCASCSSVGILLGRSCHVSPGVAVWPGDELTAHQRGRLPGPWELGQAAQPLWRQQGSSLPPEGNPLPPRTLWGRAQGHGDAGLTLSRVPQLAAVTMGQTEVPGRSCNPADTLGLLVRGRRGSQVRGAESGSSSKQPLGTLALSCVRWEHLLLPERGCGPSWLCSAVP